MVVNRYSRLQKNNGKLISDVYETKLDGESCGKVTVTVQLACCKTLAIQCCIMSDQM